MAAPLRQRRDADYRALLTVEGVPGEWLEIEVPEEWFVLGVVEFHNMFMIIIPNYSLKSEQSINKSIIFALHIKEL